MGGDDDPRYFLADACLTKSSNIDPLMEMVDKLLIGKNAAEKEGTP
ncbi:MAG: hypothetical protein ACI8V2_005310 [Candidatus Latescibacterota bacterium]|jgi:hypothetical protein